MLGTDDYFFWPGIINRFPVSTDAFCDNLNPETTFALPGSTRCDWSWRGCPPPRPLCCYASPAGCVRSTRSRALCDIACALSGRHMAAGRLLTAKHATCMSEDDSGDKVFANHDGMIPTAQVDYKLNSDSDILPNVSFTRLDLDRTVVQLKFAVSSETVRDKSDVRFRANDENAGT